MAIKLDLLEGNSFYMHERKSIEIYFPENEISLALMERIVIN